MEGERGAVPFIVNRDQPFVTESRQGINVTRIPGRFSICDCINGNNRRYPKKVWEKNLAEGSALRQSIAKNAAFGLLEHPSDGRISLQSPICILVTDAKLQSARDESTGNALTEVVGEIIIVNTMEGQKLRALIDVGYNPLVSSRGFGSVIKASDSVDEVQEDYVCEGWDVVLKPSFEKAELFVAREGKQEEGKQAPAAAPAIVESKGVNLWCVFQHLAEKTHNKPWQSITDAERDAIAAKVEAMPQAEKAALAEEFRTRQTNDAANESKPQVASSPAAAAAPVAEASKPMTVNIMNINEIKSQISAVRGVAVPKDPTRFAEGLSHLANLHQEIANYVAEDAKRNWQGQQLHDEVKSLERVWTEAAQAPSKAATKLNENYTKVLKVTKCIGEAAIGLRKKLSEALTQNAEAAQLVEELTERGQAWVAVADRRNDQIAALEHKLEVSCEALDIIKNRYNEDMTEMGRHVITLEFAEKAQTPEIQKLLKEATKPKHIIAIRETLDPEGSKKAKEAAAVAAQQESKKDCKCKKQPCICESKQEGQQAPAAAAAAPAAPLNEARVLVPSVHSISESVAMVQRLSGEKPKEESPKK